MFGHMNPQLAEMLTARLTRLKEEEGLLLAVLPDFVLAVRPGLDRDEREDTADRLLDGAEDLSLPVREESYEEAEGAERDSLSIPPDMLELAGFLDMDGLTCTVGNGRILIEYTALFSGNN